MTASLSLLNARGESDAPRDDARASPLLAAGLGNVTLVVALLRAGAQVDRVDNDGCGPLFSAVYGGYTAVAVILLYRCWGEGESKYEG